MPKQALDPSACQEGASAEECATLPEQQANLVLDPDGCPEGASLDNGECVGSPDPDTGECPPGTDPAGAQCVGEPLEIVGEPTCEGGEPPNNAGQCETVTTSDPSLCADGTAPGDLRLLK